MATRSISRNFAIRAGNSSAGKILTVPSDVRRCPTVLRPNSAIFAVFGLWFHRLPPLRRCYRLNMPLPISAEIDWRLTCVHNKKRGAAREHSAPRQVRPGAYSDPACVAVTAPRIEVTTAMNQLNACNVTTARGGRWAHVQVRQLLERAAA
jgi:hypothetical protein